MSSQRPYYNSHSSSGNVPYSSYSSLANAGMSYGPSRNQSNPSSGQYAGAMQHSSSGRGHAQSSPHVYQQGSGSQGYGMAAPAMSHDPMLNYNGASNGFAQYPNTPYTSMSGAQYPNPNMQYPGSHSQQQQFPSSSLDEYIMALGGPVPTSPMPPYGSSASQHQGNYPYPTNPSTVPPNQYMGSGTPDGFDVSVGPKKCYHCGTTSTPLWRRDPETHGTLCNACGLYLQQRHAQRPQQLIDADHDEEEGSDGGSDGAPEGPECNHCHTRQTSVWRRDKAGNQVCNACGVYQRFCGKERPLSLKRNRVKPRARSSQA
ncbi:GATA zinc finger domain-containing protein [Mycena venus]|uniref:GATA zinc finger domain-containing protein n=1 Tax=Mycena venus TaxID=2733690 RepID=A0A8H6Y131_9AGAR|nr:GATA zinc finger domain-containing protein [Mycena venus]